MVGKYIMFFKTFHSKTNKPYIKGVKYKIKSESNTHYVLSRKCRVPKKNENATYIVDQFYM